KISVIAIFLEMIRQGAKLGGIVSDEGRWWDLGTREEYLDVHRFFNREAREGRKDGNMKPLCDLRALCDSQDWPLWIHPTAQVSPAAKLLGASAVGPRVRIGDGATLTDCIVWEDAEIAV